jgi:hypothetical protein
LITTLLFTVVSLPALAVQPSSRIATVDSNVTAALPGMVHPWVTQSADRGMVDDGLQLQGLTLQFQRSAAQQAALETLIEQQNDPSSPKFHQWLTLEQFAAQFGMSATDLAKASAWLESQGFTVVKVVDSGNAIIFNGTAGQIRHAMGTEIHHYMVNGALHYANAGAVTLPAALASVIAHVSGLNDFKPMSKSRPSLAAANSSVLVPQFSSGVSGNHYLSPGDFSTIYDVAPLYSGGYTGTGQTIGIAGQTDIVLSDIAAFRAASGLTAKAPIVVLASGSSDPGTSYGDLGEADIDLEWSGAVAPGANLVYINSTNAFYSLTWGIQNRVTVNSVSTLIPIFSISYGLCEANQSSSTLIAMEAALQQAVSQGQTVIAAAGDNGAADCDYSTSNSTVTVSTHGLAVDYPASSAYVTAIGGTEFNEGTTTGATTYWNANVTGSSSGDIVSSARSYIPEMVWNDTPTATLSSYYSGLLGGGGGASILYAKPSWQAGVTGIPADGKRDVPDISLNASPVHDSYLVCTQVQLVSTSTYTGSCGNGFRIVDGTSTDNNGLTAYGGTSVGAPAFAGVVALISQKLGTTLGPVNKTLYGIASNATTYASAFHDVTVGSNQMPCITGTGCSGGVVGYTATTGYDLATGLGSIDAANLATAYAAYYTSHGGTTLAITYAPTIPAIGSAVTLTATLTYSGTVSPTGTVTFTVDGTALSPVTVASGAASASYSFATGGSHVVTAAYSGDSNFTASSGSVTIPAFTNAAGAIATTTTLTSTSASASMYSTSPTFTATVTTGTAGTLNSTVTFTIGTYSAKVSSPSCATQTCTYSYQPSSVTTSYGFSVGTTTVTAHYDGNTSYQQSTSNSVSVTVANPAFTITAPSMTVSSAANAIASTATITITSSGGFSDPVSLTLSSNTYMGCGYVTPTSVTPPANGSITAVITLGNCTNAKLVPYRYGPTSHNDVVAAGTGLGRTWFAGGIAGAGLLLAFAAFSRKRRLPRIAAVLAIVLLGGLLAGTTGCSSSGVTSSGLVPGTYQVTVTGTDSVNALIPPVSTTFTVTIN